MMICTNCDIWEENERLRAENSELRNRNAELEVQIVKLKHRLALYDYAPSSSLKQKPFRRRRIRSEVRFPGRPEGYPGTTRPLPKPDLIIEADGMNDCPRCEGELMFLYTKRRTIEELPGVQPTKIIGYEEDHYLCLNCESEIISRHPDCPPDGRFGKNVYIQTTLLKFQERLPFKKIQSVFERYGMKISPPTLLELLRRASEWVRPEYERILMSIRNSEVIYMDQTGMKVDGVQFWLWCFATSSETLFAIRGTKSQKVLEEILGKSSNNTLVCDGLRSHHCYARKSGAKIQRCWSHLLTESKELGQKYGEARALDKGLHKLFDRLKKALENEPPPEVRARLARNAKKAMKRLMTKRYTKSKVRKFIEKIRRGFRHWFTFVTTPKVEPTNNRAERALRELVIQRKIIGTLRNEKGMRIYETLPTLLETWKQRGLSLPEILSTSLTKSWEKGNVRKIDRPIRA